MKYFIVTTKNKIGSTEVIYPENYQTLLDVMIEQGTFYFTDDDGLWKRLHTISNKDAVNVRQLNLTDTIEINKQEAFDLSDKYQGGLTIDDEAQVRLIEIKQRLGDKLTADDLKAINPDDDTVKGITRKKTLKDLDKKLKVIANET